MALSGRIRVQKALGGTDKTTKDIERIVSPYLIQPSSTFGIDDGTANYAGVCWADELAETTGDKRYLRLIETAAQRFGPTITEGALDPDLRVEDIWRPAIRLPEEHNIELSGSACP